MHNIYLLMWVDYNDDPTLNLKEFTEWTTCTRKAHENRDLKQKYENVLAQGPLSPLVLT